MNSMAPDLSGLVPFMIAFFAVAAVCAVVCLAIIGVATLGKLGGSAVAARVTGMEWREALQLGALMNTRGLMELIALNIGYDIGILSPRIFTMLVLMALATTAMTGPLLTFFGAREAIGSEQAQPSSA